MKNSKEIWAIIPTREGSEELPEKNIRPLAGKPLVHYILETAKASQYLTRVVLSTDSDQIARVAGEVGGIEVLRHNRTLSIPGRPSFGVFQNAIQKLPRQGEALPRVVVLLRATAPLCLPLDIDRVLDLLLAKADFATGVISVTKSSVHPKRVYVIDEQGVLRAREETPEKEFPVTRQLFPDVYIRNAAIYATFPEIVLRGSLWGRNPLAYIMPKERSININDEIDFILAEELLKKRQSPSH